MSKLYWVLSIYILGGVLVSPASYARDYVYIMAGQSNMMGKGKTHAIPSHYKQTPNNVVFFYQGRPRKLARYAHFGPEVSFAHMVSRARPNDRHIIIKFVATGSSISQWQPGGRLFKGLLAQKKLAGIDPKTPVTAILWMQGESDARHKASAIQYQGRLARFIRALRVQLESPNAKFLIGVINPEPAVFSMTPKVQQAQRQVSMSLPNTRLISTDNLSKIFDHIHYGTQGLLDLGERFGRAIFY